MKTGNAAPEARGRTQRCHLGKAWPLVDEPGLADRLPFPLRPAGVDTRGLGSPWLGSGAQEEGRSALSGGAHQKVSQVKILT